MRRLTTTGVAAATLCGVLTFATGINGQSAAAKSRRGAVVGTGSFTAFVENMDRSLGFYHDVFGMEVPAMPESGVRPYNRPNPPLYAWFDIPGARERHQSARMPGLRAGLEFMEIQDVDHKTIPLRLQDPGTAMAVLVVRDIDGMVGRLKQANVPIVTPSGKPVVFADRTRAIIIRDIDQRFVEIRQPASLPETAAGGAGPFIELRLSITVNDMERTKQIYRDVFGFRVEGETGFAADTSLQALTGLGKAEVRRSRVQAQRSALWIEFVEYKDVDRTPLRMRIQDRGAARLQLPSENLDTLVSAVKSAGLTVVTQGGLAIPVPPNFRGALVADPNNFFVTLFEPCDGCAPNPAAAVRR
jgi:catechol 2,3-dioxygenase-like lactoylglutathione lyase family enzyme